MARPTPATRTAPAAQPAAKHTPAVEQLASVITSADAVVVGAGGVHLCRPAL